MKKGEKTTGTPDQENRNKVTIKLDARNFKSAPKTVIEEVLASTLSKAGMHGTFEAHISEENHGLEGTYNWTKFRRFSNCPPGIVMNAQIANCHAIWACTVKIPKSMLNDKVLKADIRQAAFKLKEAAIQAAPKKETPTPIPQKRSPRTIIVRQDVPTPENPKGTVSDSASKGAQAKKRAAHNKQMPIQFTKSKKLEFIAGFIQISKNENAGITTTDFAELLTKIGIQGQPDLARKFLKQNGITRSKCMGPYPAMILLTTEAKAFFHSEQEFKQPESTYQQVIRLEEVLAQKTALAESVQKELSAKNKLLERIRENLERKEGAIKELVKLKTDSPNSKKKAALLGTILSECDKEDEKILKLMRKQEKKK